MEHRNVRRRSPRARHKCPDCTHAILDELWGVYKCKKHQHRIQNPDDYTSCKDFVDATRSTEK